MIGYKIKPPMGSIMLPKEIMTEAELRAFIPQTVGDADMHEVWKEKSKNDPIEDLVELMRIGGYEITPV